ncbi:MAG: ornithine cyclodeaminase family protein [Gemmatimonadota bacterium]|nr:MAG: ornithine cyclodeaminase family protein [Gemmatimonadota bacterium]
MPEGTMLLNREDVTSLLQLDDYVEVVENAFRAYAEGETLDLGLLHVDAPDGEFHIKAGGPEKPRTYFGVKVNAGFFQNRKRFGLPNIQGTIILCDGDNGYPLAFMDSTAITINRTGATTAVAAKYLARPESRSVTICGCGTQGRIQLRHLKGILPIELAYAFDFEASVAEGFASDMSRELEIEVRAVTDLGSATKKSDVCVSCTPAKEYFLKLEDVPPGMFVAAIGADSPGKQEIDPRLMASGTVVVDILSQCAEVGELHHAIEAKIIDRDRVHGELGEVIVGRKPGRTSSDEITIFDSTGTGLQDAAAAAATYERALESGKGTYFDFFASA